MTDLQWSVFCRFKDDFKAKVGEWSARVPNLRSLQQQISQADKNPEYPFETPVVYNKSLDDIRPEDDIKLIVIGDNPGKEEQLARNNRYLVGQAGRLAEGYFRRNPELGVDFRRNVIILNKTPVHTAKTAQLRALAKAGGSEVAALLEESQIWCAQQTARLHTQLCRAVRQENQIEDDGVCPELWLVGYSELKKNGIFERYRDTLRKSYENDCGLSAEWESVFVFQHFSMNRFTIDLMDYIKKNDCGTASLQERIHSLGQIHKKEIFC